MSIDCNFCSSSPEDIKALLQAVANDLNKIKITAALVEAANTSDRIAESQQLDPNWNRNKQSTHAPRKND
ncbi:MAG: hypothetical protein ACKO8I_19400 [Cyanobacteriota bacterium]